MSTGIVVITGGGRGIGAATAVACAAAGFDVCLCYRCDRASAQEVVGGCERVGRRAVAVGADVGTEADVIALFTAADRLGPVTGLVNNAGVVAPAARVDELAAHRIEAMLRTNVVGGTVPMGRGGRPDEVAAAVVWLLSDQAAYVTGAFLDVSGGR